MEKYYIGIDPGKTGAIGVLDEHGKYINTLDFEDLQNLEYLREIAFSVEMCYIEKVWALPGNAPQRAFEFGANFGWWKGVLQSLGIPYLEKTASEWYKGLGLKKDKTLTNHKPSLMAARQLFPSAPLKLQKHSGRSDALMIAYKCFLDNK